MLAEAYVEALLVDPVQADRVWYLWDVGLISDEVAVAAWLAIAVGGIGSQQQTGLC